MKLKRFTREQRLRIYKEALRSFEKMAKQPDHKDHVTGMCKHIDDAIERLRMNRNGTYDIQMCRKNYPEYFSYKPKTFWRDNDNWCSGFWWSTKTPKGRERRLRVLRAIADGLDKSITGPLP